MFSVFETDRALLSRSERRLSAKAGTQTASPFGPDAGKPCVFRESNYLKERIRLAYRF